MTLDKRALDNWITREPELTSPILVTEDNFAEVMGDDLLINELRCSWTNQYIGYTDYETVDANGNEHYRVAFGEFYVLDCDCEVLVSLAAYEEYLDSEAENDERLARLQAEADAEWAESCGLDKP